MQCKRRHKNSPDTHRTEMAREKGFFPVPNLRDPFIQHEHGRDPPDEQDCNAQSRQSPRCDPQFGYVKVLKGQPRADIDEACTVEHKVNNGCKNFSFGVNVEIAVP